MNKVEKSDRLREKIGRVNVILRINFVLSLVISIPIVMGAVATILNGTESSSMDWVMLTIALVVGGYGIFCTSQQIKIDETEEYKELLENNEVR